MCKNHFHKTYFFLFLFVCFFGYGQQKVRFLERLDVKKYHWGFYLGAQYQGYNVLYKDQLEYSEAIVSIPNAYGFNVGLVGGWRINPYMSLRVEPGFASTRTSITFMNPVLNEGTKENPIPPQNEMSINALRLPFYLKLNGHRYGNIRPFAMFGLAYEHNFSSNQNSEEDNESNIYRATTYNMAYEFGIGMDFYTPYFKFSPAIKAVYTVNNQLVQDIDPKSPYTSYINEIKSRGVFITFYFE